MQYIKRSECPQLLATNQETWTISWVVYYRVGVEIVPPKKPTDSHWLKDEIRFLLIKDFHNNCGFCGESIPTPQSLTTRTSKGDVEHFLPKSKYPEFVYEWTNYIWSCKPCNEHKKEFYNVSYPLLNPCRKKDCENLMFSEDTGCYVLQERNRL